MRERVRQLEAALSGAGASISVGAISGSTAVAIGENIYQVVNQSTNMPNGLLARLTALADSIEDRRAAIIPQAAGHVRIFLASPGDVQDERRMAWKAIARVQSHPSFKKLVIEAVAWDKPDDSTPLLAGLDPQSAIRQGLPRPSESDIFVAIFWSRLGTPLDSAHYHKPDGSPYLSGTEWELDEALQAFKERGRPLVLVYRRAQKISLDPDAPDFLEKAAQWQRVQDFFAASKNPDGSIRLSYNEYASPSKFGKLFENHLARLIYQLVEDGRLAAGPAPAPSPGKTVPALAWPKDRSPFPGLRAFGPEDAPVFFGRGAETDRLLERLADPNGRFLAVVGASGSGKSSLVGAGLLPRLREGALPGSETWPVARFTPDAWGNGDPFDALTQALGQPPLALDARDVGRRLRVQ